ncbi:MAG TPA: DinB family protein [bacterium]|nr:DinB family protein [bacterium]
MGTRSGPPGRRLNGSADALARRDLARFRDDTFGERNWGHKGLRAALRGVSLEEALWTPGRGVHSVWEQINHVAHWKRYVLERLHGRSRQTNQAWPAAGRTAGDLRRAIVALDRLHRALQHAILRLSPGAFEAGAGPRYSTTQLLLGEAAHDAYHTGQIFLTRRLYRQRRRAV